MKQFRVQSIFFFIVFLFFFFLVARVFYPFSTVILWSGLLYLVCSPLYHKLAGKSDRIGFIGNTRKRLFAGLLAILSVLLVVVPLALIAIVIVKQLSDLLAWIVRLIDENPRLVRLDPDSPLVSFIRDFSDGNIDIAKIDIRNELTTIFRQSASRLFGFSTAVLKNLGKFGLTLVFMVFSLYFFFLDGDYLIKLLIKAVPIEPLYMRLFITKVKETAKHLMRGYVLVALYQGLVGFLLFLLFKVKGALLLAVLVSFCSFIPMIGAATVWFPAGLMKLIQGHVPQGIGLLVLSALLISTLDNLLRPFLLHDKIKIHPLLIFFAILGGLTVLGFNGLILGPMIIVLFFSALDIFRDLYPNSEAAPAEAPSAAQAGEAKKGE